MAPGGEVQLGSPKRESRHSEGAVLHFDVGSFDGERRDINSEYVPNRVRPAKFAFRAGTCTDLKRRSRRHTARSDELDQ